MKTEKELKKEGRGSMDSFISDDGILIVKWFDNKEVIVGSNHYGTQPTTVVKRWDKKEKKYVDVTRPFVIQAYNNGMGGVDHCDQLLSFYRLKTKSVKWYKRFLYHFTDLAVVNSYILWKAVHKARLTRQYLYQYKLNVALGLMYAENLSEPLSRSALLLLQDGPKAANGDRVGDGDPTDAVRLDGMNHLPDVAAVVARCCKIKGCKLRSVIWCTKCHVYLCMKKNKNCFLTYHTVE